MSLRSMCRDLVLETLLRHFSSMVTPAGLDDASGSHNPFADDVGRMQLIVDDATQRVINSFLRMSDLIEGGVISIELAESQREPLPDLDALYLLRPSMENVDILLEDFKVQAKPQHNQVCLAFTSALRSELLERLASAQHLPPRVRSLVEVPLNFVAIQDRGFHFDLPECIPLLFSTPVSGQGQAMVADIATRLADVCRCLQATSPRIFHARSDICEEVADHVRSLLERHKRPSMASKKETPCQLLIVDRSFDMAATLVHEYTYEASMYDLLDGDILDVDRHVVTLGGSGRGSPSVRPRKHSILGGSLSGFQESPEKKSFPKPGKQAVLCDSDSFWAEKKYEHIALLMQNVGQRLRDYVIQQQEARADLADLDFGDLLDQVRSMPEHMETVEMLNRHQELLDTIANRMREARLMGAEGPGPVGKLEQEIACGVTEEGTDVKPEKLQRRLADIVSSGEDELPSESKLRLLMLYLSCMANVHEQIMSIGSNLDPLDSAVLLAMRRSKLMEVPESQKQMLGTAQVHRAVKLKRSGRFKQKAKMMRNQALFEPWFVPRVKELFEQLLDGKLSEDEFLPHTEEDKTTEVMNSSFMSSSSGGLRSAGNAGSAPLAPALDDWSFASYVAPAAGQTNGRATTSTPAEVSQRFVIFIIGGLTHSELRAAAEVTKEAASGTELLVGGTSILTPKRLMQTLRGKQSAAQGTLDDPEDLV